MSEEATSPSADCGTGFAAAFAAILSLFGILPTGKLAAAATTSSVAITGGSHPAPANEESRTESR